MQNQDSVTLVFERMVFAVRSVSFMKQVSPILFVIVAWGGLFAKPGTPILDAFASVAAIAGSTFASSTFSEAPISPLANADVAQVRPVLILTKEQKNLASYLSKAYQTDAEEISEYIATAYAAGKSLKVDPLLVLAIMSIESSFDPEAQSAAGAQGLMQVLTRVHVEKFLPFGGASSAFDVRANILVGTQIIQEYIKREGSVESALKSYVGAALLNDDGGYGWKVMAQRSRLQAAALGKPIPKIADQKPVEKIEALLDGMAKQDETFVMRESAKVIRASYEPSSTQAPVGLAAPAALVPGSATVLPAPAAAVTSAD